MEIWHRIGYNENIHPKWEKTLQDSGIPYTSLPLPGQVTGTIVFDIAESDPHWNVVAEEFIPAGISNVYDTLFTPEEITSTEWVRLVPVFEQGYPQPRGSLAWHDLVRDGTCGNCGVGFVQIAPFHLAKEPHLGKNAFMSLFGTYTLLRTPNVVSALQEHGIRGHEVWNALIHRTKQPSTVVSQLVFPLSTSPGLRDADKVLADFGIRALLKEWHAICPVCGIAKYTPHTRGYMHVQSGAFPPDTDAVQSYEWFGSGRGAYREIFISNRFARLILEQGWRGVRLKPVELV